MKPVRASREGLRIVLAIAAVFLVVFGVGWLGRDDTQLWRLDGRTISGGERLSPAVWATGPTLAITRARDVTGYDAATGDPRWTVPLSGKVCAASARPAGRRVAVQFGQGKPGCDSVAVIDLGTGTKVWERAVAPAERLSRGQVVIGGDAVVVDWLYGTAAFRLDDGRPLWNVRNLPDRKDCAFDDLAGGPALVARQSCDTERGVSRVHGLDPLTGRTLWKYPVPPQYRGAAILSTRPTVLGLHFDQRVSRFVVLDGSGTQVTSIDVGGGYPMDCSGDGHCVRAVVTADSLYVNAKATGNSLVVKPQAESFPPIVSYDLATGRARWTTRNPDGNHLFPVAPDGGRLVAVQPKTAGKNGRPPRLVAVDAATGATSFMWNLSGASDFRVRRGADRQYAQGRFFVTKALVTGDEEAALSAYGPNE